MGVDLSTAYALVQLTTSGSTCLLCLHPQGGRRNWKRRWVVVRATQFIAWYDSDAATETKGSMALHGAQVTALVAIQLLLLLLLLLY